MSNFKDRLEKEWELEKEKLNKMGDYDSNAYKVQAERVAHLETKLTELENKEIEVEERAAGRDIDERLKEAEMENEKKDRKIRYVLDACKIGLPLAGALFISLFSMRYEDENIVTTTAGKSSIKDLIRFKI